MGSSSVSEGEVIESDSEKATTAQTIINGTLVDRHSRSPGAAPQRASYERSYERSRSRSPFRHNQRRRSPRGEKRRRIDDDYDDFDRSDRRRFRVQNERRGSVEDVGRDRYSYVDFDKSHPSYPSLSYGDRDDDRRHWSPRAKSRSRSPDRSSRRNDHRGGGDGRDRVSRSDGRRWKDRDGRPWGDDRKWDMKSNKGSSRNEYPLTTRTSKNITETFNGSFTQDISKSAKDVDRASKKPLSHNNVPAEENLELAQALIEPVDESKLIEERRKRREAIKAKYKGQASPLLSHALQLRNGNEGREEKVKIKENSEQPKSPVVSTLAIPKSPNKSSALESPSAIVVADDEDLANDVGLGEGSNEVDEPSAADYDPIQDMQEDKARDDQRHLAENVSARQHDETTQTDKAILLPEAEGEGSKAKKNKGGDFDMFAEDDDEDDLFAQSPRKPDPKPAKAVSAQQAKRLDESLLDDWDDVDGYYNVILGELLDGRYHVQENLGRGMFSGVVRATETTRKSLVAIKIIRNNETMRKAGMKEITILKKLSAADPDDKHHLIRLERHFEHKGHLCMVFENLSINLREVLKKFGRDVGINIRAVRSYAQQMFMGLRLLKNSNILHADLKPDNVLVNHARNVLKICDLGSAADASENEITPYLVSRFYRAPEIILGAPYDFAIDTWSIGCTLYELYTGKILFTGRTNNQMLRSMMECRGKFSLKMLKKAEFAAAHFDENLHFKSFEKDKITGRDVVRLINFTKPSRDLKSRLIATTKGLNDVEMRELKLFVDLLDRCLSLNPEKRITPKEALKHPFIARTKG